MPIGIGEVEKSTKRVGKNFISTKVEDQKSNRRGRRQKTSESNPLRSPPPDQVRLGTPVPYSQSRESKMTETQKSVKYRMVKSYLTHTRTQRDDMDDVGPRWWRWTEMGRPTRFREEHRATEVEASSCSRRRSVTKYRAPNQMIKVVSGRSSRIEPRAPYYSTPMRVVYAPSKQREQTAIAGRERTLQHMKRSHA